ncbi:MAG: hypothetical protein ACPGJE_09710, partial [Wenzhouxiangellaceae bacterium]
MPDSRSAITAFAPASVGNVGVGFDLLGHAVSGLGDRVTVRAGEPGSGIRIGAIRGADAPLPTAAERNTAGRAIQALCDASRKSPDLRIEIDKGIPVMTGASVEVSDAASGEVEVRWSPPTDADTVEAFP